MIYLYSGAGIPNFGDELIAAHWLRFVDGRPVVIDCFNVVRAKQSLSKINLSARFVRCIGKVSSISLSEMPAATFWDHVRFGRQCLNSKLGDAIRTHLSGITQFHMIGGGYINSQWPQTGALLGAALAIRENLGIRIVGTGLGITPIPVPDDAGLARDVFGAFDIIELRDSEGFAFVKAHSPDANSANGTDDSFLYPVYKREGQRAAHISCHYNGEMRADFIRIAKQALPNGLPTYFWSCHPERDCGAAMREFFPDLIQLDCNDLLSCNHVAPGDLMITSRFHPHLIAARAGAQGVFTSATAYYDTKHRSIVDLGSGFGLEPGPNILAKREMELVGEKRLIANRLYPFSAAG